MSGDNQGLWLGNMQLDHKKAHILLLSHVEELYLLQSEDQSPNTSFLYDKLD